MKAILLNGPSSAGKSSISKELCGLICCGDRSNTRIISIDDYVVASPQEPIWEDDVFGIMPQMCADVKDAVQQGQNVIIDHVITSERIFDSLMLALSEFDTVIRVLVKCSLSILRERERRRRDRYIGSAEDSLKYLYPQDGYDVFIDSGNSSPAEAARIIAAIF